jgi:hypothetical protein
MAQNGWRDDVERREEADVVADGVSVTAQRLHDCEPGELTTAELMRAQSHERPRSLLARVFGASPVTIESEQLFARALGERAVGELLAQLGDGWSALHSLSVGSQGATIDHLVMGPAGVFTVTTRHHSGQAVIVSGRTVLVDGAKVAHIRDAEHDLGRAERRLSAALGESLIVTGLLVFVDPASLMHRAVPKDLQVLGSHELVPWIEAQPDLFTESEVERIVDVAHMSTTWGAPLSAVRTSHTHELERLLRAVERSRTLRQFWFGFVTIVVVITATALGTIAIVGMSPAGTH